MVLRRIVIGSLVNVGSFREGPGELIPNEVVCILQKANLIGSRLTIARRCGLCGCILIPIFLLAQSLLIRVNFYVLMRVLEPHPAVEVLGGIRVDTHRQ